MGGGPAVCDPSRSRVSLIVVGVDPMALDVDQVIRAKQGLIRCDPSRVLEPICKIGGSRKVSISEFEFHFAAVILSFFVVERRERVSLSELPIVNQISGDLVVDAHAKLEAGTIRARGGSLGGPAECRRTLRQQF